MQNDPPTDNALAAVMAQLPESLRALLLNYQNGLPGIPFASVVELGVIANNILVSTTEENKHHVDTMSATLEEQREAAEQRMREAQAKTDRANATMDQAIAMLEEARTLTRKAHAVFQRVESIARDTQQQQHEQAQLADAVRTEITMLQRQLAALGVSGEGSPTRRGPKGLAANIWARERIAEGMTVNQIVETYADKRGISDLAYARLLLRRALRTPITGT